MHFKPLPSPKPGVRCWGADAGRFRFVISQEDSTKLRPRDKPDSAGYTATYKSNENPRASAVMINGRWQSFTAAEQACRDTWQQLRQKK